MNSFKTPKELFINKMGTISGTLMYHSTVLLSKAY